MSDEVIVEGAFAESLSRNGSKIRKDRAISISEDAEMAYTRCIQDTQTSIKRLNRQRESMLDMSPDNTYSIISVSDFDALKFVDKDIDLGVQIRNEEIKLEIAQKRYDYLFKGVK